ncbi:hypothetical protein IMW82_13465 [Rhodanobacter sp. B2A1Ga4]|uniref:hypothetical protein n=1 Tax=Rhodanobacter sp. B2A1Ga4 TaxID=2778647 RepID=UPI001B399A58|nr:hypothetical protein [Rhodanobacter sp. B2A1Ga4]MBQ4855680.1 hypothetical protein [Rhodanobacter sp. B2A1Ga4]
MSYCRFSCNQYQSDAYVYAGLGGGFVTHVAARRYVFDHPLPAPVPFDGENIDAYVKYAAELQSRVDTATFVPIDLPHAGATFDDADAGACVKRLLSLRELGYRVPQDAIDSLLEETLPQTRRDLTGNQVPSDCARPQGQAAPVCTRCDGRGRTTAHAVSCSWCGGTGDEPRDATRAHGTE